MRIVFPYLAQPHQVLHSLPIAAELARRHRSVTVEIAATSASLLDWAQRLVQRHAPDAPLRYTRLAVTPIDRVRLRAGLCSVPGKKQTLVRNRGYFAGFDAVVTPERTSLFLRRLALPRTRLIWTGHGAGDREVGFASDICQFDFVLMAGRKIEQRMLDAALIRPGDYRGGIYSKFDWALAQPGPRPRLFDNERPTVLYNPHFWPEFSSWPSMGHAVLDHFARSTRYNLIFAPHVRLLDTAAKVRRAQLGRYAGLPHLLIDPGSERSIDMSYTTAADLYLGDVSSQVAEFLFQPRPCLFLDAHHAAWQGNPNYEFWTLGPVLDTPQALEDGIAAAVDRHAERLPAQRRYVADTFGLEPGQRSAADGADAIVEFLSRRRG